jgi:hypothetical protein
VQLLKTTYKLYMPTYQTLRSLMSLALTHLLQSILSTLEWALNVLNRVVEVVHLVRVLLVANQHLHLKTNDVVDTLMQARLQAELLALEDLEDHYNG